MIMGNYFRLCVLASGTNFVWPCLLQHIFSENKQCRTFQRIDMLICDLMPTAKLLMSPGVPVDLFMWPTVTTLNECDARLAYRKSPFINLASDPFAQPLRMLWRLFTPSNDPKAGQNPIVIALGTAGTCCTARI